jgi:hypothetical protein
MDFPRGGFAATIAEEELEATPEVQVSIHFKALA